MNPLCDAALCRSTPIHHTLQFYAKCELVGARPLHLAAQDRNANLSGRGPSILLRKTVRSLKSPTGAFIAPLRCANANLSGRGPSILLRKTVRSLKSPTGAFIAPLRCANANNALFALHKILHRLAYGVVFTGNPSKEKARNFSVHQKVSGFVLLKLEIYWSMGFIVGNSSTSRMEALSVSSITRRSTPKPRPPVGGRPYSSALT